MPRQMDYETPRPMPVLEGPYERQQHSRMGQVFNRHTGRLAVTAGIGLAAIIGVSDVISSCSGGAIEQATQVGDLGAVLENVAVPKAPIGLMEGDGVASGEVESAKYLHMPKLPLIGFLSSAVNSGLEKLYQTSATARVKTSVEIMMDGDALTLKPYKLPKGSATGIGGQGVEAAVKVTGLTSELVTKRPVQPAESSGEGVGTRIAGIVLGNNNSTETDNAAITVAEQYFQNVCGHALLDVSSVGVERYVQNIFRLDAGYFKGFPGVSPAADREMATLANQPVRVVFTHQGHPVNPIDLDPYVQNFGPPIPNSQSVAAMLNNTPNNVTVPREFNGCMSTSFAIGQQEKLIQQAAQATGASHAGT